MTMTLFVMMIMIKSVIIITAEDGNENNLNNLMTKSSIITQG